MLIVRGLPTVPIEEFIEIDLPSHLKEINGQNET